MPDQHARLRLLQLPPFGLLAPMMMSAEGRVSTRMTHLAEERSQRCSGLSYLVPPWGTLARATCLIESVPGCCQVRILGGLARVWLVKPDRSFPAC
jgi:hypothetical protein